MQIRPGLVGERQAGRAQGQASLLPSRVPGVRGSLPTPPPLLRPLLSSPGAEPPSQPGASHGERRRKRRGGAERKGQGGAGGAKRDNSKPPARPRPLSSGDEGSSSPAGYNKSVRRQGVINNQLGGSLRLL